MNDDLESCNDFECSNEFGMEEDADKLNDVTFGDDIAWNYKNLNSANDDTTFERFPFDDFELNQNDQNASTNDRCESDSYNLLGLKGSFVNFGLFKSTKNNDDKEPLIYKTDNEFEEAMGQLRLMEMCRDNENDLNEFVGLPEVISGMGPEFEVSSETPFVQLTNYADMLFQQFQECKQRGCNTQILNTIVAEHLKLLSKKLIQLSLPMDIIVNLRYFRLLTTFTSVDNQINEIYARYGSDQRSLNAELSALVCKFHMQSPEQQMDLSIIHPFYSGVMHMQKQLPPLLAPGNFIGSQFQLDANRIRMMQYNGVIQGLLQPGGIIRGPLQRTQQYQGSPQMPQNIYMRSTLTPIHPICDNESGWMVQSERDWIMKLQTRNLVSDNPYVHDYYYTVLKFREMNQTRYSQFESTGESTIPDPISLLPSPITADQLGAGIDNTKEGGIASFYRPVKFENSLGVVTTSNLNTPRQTIEVPTRHSITVKPESANDSYSAVRSHRELLGLIERMYCTVLRIDEVDKSLTKILVEQHRHRSVLIQYRNNLLQVLMTCVQNDEKFVQLFSVSKGGRVFSSVLEVVTSLQFVEIMKTFFVNFFTIWQSDCFGEFESDYRSIIVSRLKKLDKPGLSQLITTLFNHLTSPIIDKDKSQVHLLSTFCGTEFGLYIVFTTLDAFSAISPDDREIIRSLVDLTIQSSDSQSSIKNIVKEFQVLFTQISK